MSKSKEYIPYGFVQSTQKEKGFYQLLTLLSTLFSWKLSSIEKVKELLITNSRKLERKVDEMILKLVHITWNQLEILKKGFIK